MAQPPKALNEFVSEAQEIIESLSRDLLRLGDQRAEPDPDLVNRVFRGAHSLKGLSGMFGVTRLSHLAHASEDLLDDVRMGRVELSDEVLDLLLEVIEVMHRMLAEVTGGDDGEAEGGSAALAENLAERIRTRREGKSAAPSDPLDAIGLDPSVRAVLTEYEEHRLRENVKKGVALLRVRAAFELADFDKGLADLNGRLKQLGEVISTLPSADPSAGGIAFDLIFGTGKPADEIRRTLEGLPAELHPFANAPAAAPAQAEPKRAARKPRPAPAPEPEPEPESAPEPAVRATVELGPATEIESTAASERRRTGEGAPDLSLRSVSQTVRVDIRKLDRLMNIVGELVLAKTNLQRVTDAIRAGTLTEALDPGTELQRETRVLERKLDELQKGILEVRMVPLGQVFDKLARMVRKIAREAGKEIDFRIGGGDVELDKLIVEDLSDPLMHIIRNAIDHGVEAPEERAAKGKSRRGTVTLSARQKGNHVEIEVGDDGAGIDEEAVRTAAIQKGLTTPQAARELARRDVLNFIFMPGFSTAKQVSELSGRGVGLDVVKTNIANLSGIIDVRSARGAGTTIAITLPVTLAIIRALVVQVAGRTYAVPLNSVLEILSIEKQAVRTIETREVVDVRGTTLPLVRLSRLFRLSGATAPSKMFVVVVGLAQDRLGIAVDELIGQQDVVVKPLGPVLSGVRGIAGATDLGQRRTVLVLDVGAIIEEVLAGERAMLEASA